MHRRVRRLPRDPGPSGWNSILPPRLPNPPLDEHITADVAIVGAGFAGLSSAMRLQQIDPLMKVVLLEATTLADGPVGRNSGFMIDLPHELSSADYLGPVDDHQAIDLNRHAIEFAGQIAKQYEFPIEAFDRCGKINGAATDHGDKHNRAYAKHLKNIGEDFELYDAAKMQQITGSAYYLSGVYTPGTVMLQPALWARCLAETLTSQPGNHVKVYETSPVIDLQMVNRNWRLQTPAGSVIAPKVILATNGHAQSFGFFERQLVHLILYASMTRALTDREVEQLGGEPKWGITPSDPMGTTVRRVTGIGGQRMIIRNQATYAPNLEVSDQVLDRLTNRHSTSLQNRYPDLDPIEMQYQWGGRLCLSLNGVPAFGEIEKNLFSACCQNGLGTTKGTLSGMLAAELSCGLMSKELEIISSMPDPKPLPLEPFATIGAKSTLAWRQFRAGREL